MKLAICLFNYFSHGGLERNFLRISRECRGRGHAVEVFTMKWEGERPQDITIHELVPRGLSNHRQAAYFARQATNRLAGGDHDLVLGFNRMPGLDLYYAADVCYVARIGRQRSFFARLTPRYHLFAAFERAVFAPEAATDIILLSEQEKDLYQSVYHTPEERFHLVPPGVDRERIRAAVTPANRVRVRQELALAADDTLLLMIGSHFHTKGVDRAIRALAALPPERRRTSHLCVIGKGEERSCRRLAAKSGISSQVHFLGVRQDIADFLAAADLLLQPSRTENTGNAIVEALVAGVPVMATATCGYAVHVERSGAGRIIPSSPFNQDTMNRMLGELLCAADRDQWRRQALAYADRTDLYHRFPVIADIIEACARKKRERRGP